jgi:hypothetical protein
MRPPPASDVTANARSARALMQSVERAMEGAAPKKASDTFAASAFRQLAQTQRRATPGAEIGGG